jgi:hypothetical protein
MSKTPPPSAPTGKPSTASGLWPKGYALLEPNTYNVNYNTPREELSWHMRAMPALREMGKPDDEAEVLAMVELSGLEFFITHNELKAWEVSRMVDGEPVHPIRRFERLGALLGHLEYNEVPRLSGACDEGE